MRTSILAAVPLLLITNAVVLGADIGRRLAPAPVAAAGGTWNGFYIGLNGGGGIANATSNFDVGGVPFGTAKNSLTSPVSLGLPRSERGSTG